MNGKKLFPQIKIISFAENDISTPLCECDYHHFRPLLDSSLCLTHDSDGMPCALVTRCSCHSKCACDLKCACDFDIRPTCYSHVDCSCDIDYLGLGHKKKIDLLVPTYSDLPTGCECFSTKDAHEIIKQVTEISQFESKTLYQKIDKRTGEIIEEIIE